MKTLLLSSLTILLSLYLEDLNAPEIKEPQYIYVCNQNSASVTIIDAQKNEVSETIDLQELGFSENAKPHHAIAEPDGSFWYVTLIGENRVLKFDRENKLVSSAALEVPGLMTLHPTNNDLYVGRSMSAVNPPQSFATINRKNMSVQKETDLFFSRPHAIASLHSKTQIFVASLSSNQFISLNTVSEEMELKNLEGQNNVFVNFAISPDGNTMVGTGQISGKLLVFDISDPDTPELTNSISVEAMPWHPVYSPDGKYVYFANKGANAVTIVNMQTEKVENVIKGKGLAQPHGAVLSLDGKFLYVSNNNMIMKGMGMDMNMDKEETMDHGNMNLGNMEHHSQTKNGSVVIIDTEKREIVKVIEVGMNATGIGTNAR